MAWYSVRSEIMQTVEVHVRNIRGDLNQFEESTEVELLARLDTGQKWLR